MDHRVWLILGPSGAGKSSFGEWLAAERNWLHLEIDQFPKDGIDVNNLRGEWDEFYGRGNAECLGEVLRQRLEANSSTLCPYFSREGGTASRPHDCRHPSPFTSN